MKKQRSVTLKQFINSQRKFSRTPPTAADHLFTKEFKAKFNNKEISTAIDKLVKSLAKYKSVVRHKAFFVGVDFGIRLK